MRNNLKDLSCLDIYLSTLSTEAYEKVMAALAPTNVQELPLKSWDMYSEYYFNELQRMRRENYISEFKELASKLGWKNDFDPIFENETFEALVVTNMDKEIIWVNTGFSEMTGYDKKFAINKTPAFLQGEKTSEASKKHIRKQIATGKPFSAVITNYKKDNTPYECELKIFPLYTENTTHYLALEKKAG